MLEVDGTILLCQEFGAILLMIIGMASAVPQTRVFTSFLVVMVDFWVSWGGLSNAWYRREPYKIITKFMVPGFKYGDSIVYLEVFVASDRASVQLRTKHL